jgi:hypothetical protein
VAALASLLRGGKYHYEHEPVVMDPLTLEEAEAAA